MLDKKLSISAIVETIDQSWIKGLNKLIIKLGSVEDAIEVLLLGHFEDAGLDWVNCDEDFDVVLNTVAANPAQFVYEMDKKFNNINW